MLLMISRGQVHYTAADFLPGVLSNSTVGHSYDPTKTAFQQAVGTKLSLFDWLHEMIPESDRDWRPVAARRHPAEDIVHKPSEASKLSEETASRPEKDQFHLAMAGVGRGSEQYYIHDFPWQRIGNGTVVDVGGGIGKSHSRFLNYRLNVVLMHRQVDSVCSYTTLIQSSISLSKTGSP